MALFFDFVLKSIFKIRFRPLVSRATWGVVACVALLAVVCTPAAWADDEPETLWHLGSRTSLPVDVRLSTELRKSDIPCDPDETEGDVVLSTRLGRLTVEATLASTRKVQVGESAETVYVVAVRHPLAGDVSGGVELTLNGADSGRTLLPGMYVRLSPRARLMFGVEVPLDAAAATAKTARAQLNWAF